MPALELILAAANKAGDLMKSVDDPISQAMSRNGTFKRNPGLTKFLASMGSVLGMPNIGNAASEYQFEHSTGGVRSNAYLQANNPFQDPNALNIENGYSSAEIAVDALKDYPNSGTKLNPDGTPKVPQTTAEILKSFNEIPSVKALTPKQTIPGSQFAIDNEVPLSANANILPNPTDVTPKEKSGKVSPEMISTGMQAAASLAQIAVGAISGSKNKMPPSTATNFMKGLYSDAQMRAKIGLPMIEQNRMLDEIENQKREAIASGASTSMGSSGASYNRAVQAMKGADDATLNVMIADQKFIDEKTKDASSIGSQLAGILGSWDQMQVSEYNAKDQATAGLIAAGMTGINNAANNSTSTDYYKKLLERKVKP